MDVNEQMAALAAAFADCRKAFTAMGDENRQLIILAFLRHPGGMRVGELMEEVRLSRPALSHHLRILKEAGIVDMFKIGTKNYYHLSGDKKNWDRFTVLMRQIEALMAQGNKDCSQRKELVRKCNAESGLNIQLCFDEEEAFQGMMAHYGKFHNVRNYIALVGKKDDRLDETCGYYGEQLVLKATELGLSTCWVAMTDRKRRTVCVINKGEKLCCVIALGYGENEGVPHKSKRIEEVCDVEGELPAWFAQGVRCALLAPTAMNQQKFRFTLRDGRVSLRASFGPYTKVDLGIVRCHFALGAGKGDWQWAEDER